MKFEVNSEDVIKKIEDEIEALKKEKLLNISKLKNQYFYICGMLDICPQLDILEYETWLELRGKLEETFYLLRKELVA